jgi:hypothetical protein
MCVVGERRGGGRFVPGYSFEAIGMLIVEDSYFYLALLKASMLIVEDSA